MSVVEPEFSPESRWRDFEVLNEGLRQLFLGRPDQPRQGADAEVLIDALTHDRDGLDDASIRAVECHFFQRVQVGGREVQLFSIGDQVLDRLAGTGQAAVAQHDFPGRFHGGDSARTGEHVAVPNQR
ncbi:hypothetical protein D3C76_1496500 [compost metagenome]